MAARLDPKDRPPLQPDALIDALAARELRWVLGGSHVLALHGADLVANDLDVIPELSAENLARVAAVLRDFSAVAAYLDGWGGDRGTLEACHAWRPQPPTVEHLDWLYVTPLGMLDIVIEKAEPYAVAMEGASRRHTAKGTPYWCCDPRRVLKALEGRSRTKDMVRAEEYDRMRQKFGMS